MNDGTSRTDRLAHTRQALHAVAEQVLAGPQHRRTGSIKLVVDETGFATGRLPGVPSLIAVRGPQLVAVGADAEQVAPLSGTIAELARAIGVEAGVPEGVYEDGSNTDPSFEVSIDEPSLRQILQSLRWGDRALHAMLDEFGQDEPQVPVLWPEHFDVAITLDEVNYGVSPGDSLLAEPYAYVGPWQQRSGHFWDQPFGAARLVGDLGSEEAVLAFFHQGRRAARRDPVA